MSGSKPELVVTCGDRETLRTFLASSFPLAVAERFAVEWALCVHEDDRGVAARWTELSLPGARVSWVRSERREAFVERLALLFEKTRPAAVVLLSAVGDPATSVALELAERFVIPSVM